MNEIVKVMVNGIPGNMASNVAKHVLGDDRFELIPHTLTGPEVTASELVIGSRKIALISPNRREEAIAAILKSEGAFISVDFTHPSAVNSNAEFYCNHSLPFVMGTTGGDRKRFNETVVGSAIGAVIAPNMAKQIVGFQAMMEYAANVFPNLFDGYSLEIRESHQKGKADTSGTAKAMGVFCQIGDSIFRKRNRHGTQPRYSENSSGYSGTIFGRPWLAYLYVGFVGQNCKVRVRSQCQWTGHLCHGYARCYYLSEQKGKG